MKKTKYFIQACFVYALYFVFRILPLPIASALGGMLGQVVGRFMKSSQTALKNLDDVFPDKTLVEKQRIIKDMWNNLGRVFSEYPHLKTIATNHVTTINQNILDNAQNSPKSVIYMGGHIANWEIGGAISIVKYGDPLRLVYRAPNNPWVARLLSRMRSIDKEIDYIEKSKTGGRQLVKALQNREDIAILIDQKYNEGIPVPFFGRDAMTSPAVIQLAQKFDCLIVPVRIIRLKGSHFEFEASQPLTLYDDNGAPLPATQVLTEMHGHLEAWITQHPEQWLWIHRRWPNNA